MGSREVAIALGANLGNPLEAFISAREHFQNDCAVGDSWEQSSLYETAPVDCPEGSPPYMNAVILFQYNGTAEELLHSCKKLEKESGRPTDGATGEKNLPRTLDADILYLGTEITDFPHLIIPHPRMRERRFVLEPLAEVRPDLMLPGDRVSVIKHLMNCTGQDCVLVRKDW